MFSPVKGAFAGAMKGAGIENFPCQDLRYAFASRLVIKRGAIKDVQEPFGRKETRMTKFCAHGSPVHKQKAVSLLNRLTAYSEEGCHKMITCNFLNSLVELNGIEPSTS